LRSAAVAALPATAMAPRRRQPPPPSSPGPSSAGSRSGRTTCRPHRGERSIRRCAKRGRSAPMR